MTYPHMRPHLKGKGFVCAIVIYDCQAT